MGPRNLLILFFSTVAVSLVILIIFFSLFFKNVDLNFNTRLPESAPDPLMGKGMSINQESKASGLLRSTVNVPSDYAGGSGGGVVTDKPEEEEEETDTELDPVTDDPMLQNEPTAAEPPPAPKPRNPNYVPPAPAGPPIPSGPPIPTNDNPPEPAAFNPPPPSNPAPLRQPG